MSNPTDPDAALVERVAVALCRKEYDDQRYTWNMLTERERAGFGGLARAAIAEMREGEASDRDEFIATGRASQSAPTPASVSADAVEVAAKAINDRFATGYPYARDVADTVLRAIGRGPKSS